MKRYLLRLVQATLFYTILVSPFYSVSAQPVLGFTSFITGLSSPVDITHAGDGSGRLFIVEKGGRIMIHSGGSLLPTPFLDITPLVTSGGERGLLSVAFHPDYETNRYFYVYYTNNPLGSIIIARYQAQELAPNLADPASGLIMMTIPKPFDNHNGGDLNFGPDGMLYFGTGDGGSGGDPFNAAQSGTSLLGKMIRINVNDSILAPYYSIPPTNPYTADPDVDDHIWALGLRNPWRWSFDRLTGDMWVADVGQGASEEVNVREPGTSGGINYGWRCYEGTLPYNTAGCLPQSSYVSPIFEYPHDFATGGFSITGGFVYRGTEWAALEGYYICADFVSGNVWIVRSLGGGVFANRRQGGLTSGIAGFGEAEDGTMYAVALAGTVYKIDVTAVLPVSLLSFSGAKGTGYNELKWKTVSEININRYVIEYSTDGSSWTTAGEVSALNEPGDLNYSYRHYTNLAGRLLYRLRIEGNNGTITYSPIITINGKGSVRIFPTVITSGNLQVVADEPVTRINIIDHNGKLVMSRQTGGQEGYFSLPLPVLSRGLYIVQLQTRSGNETVKVMIE